MLTESLIQQGADVNAANVNVVTRFGRTPLHYAVSKNAVAIAEVLLKHGANPNTNADTFGRTPLHYAAQKNAVAIAEVLLKHGADPNAKNRDGQTPLHYAAQKNAVVMAEVLLKHGADPNAQAEYPTLLTPLAQAALTNAAAIAEVLLKHGADINIKNNRGETPLDRTAHETGVLLRRYMLSHSSGQE